MQVLLIPPLNFSNLGPFCDFVHTGITFVSLKFAAFRKVKTSPVTPVDQDSTSTSQKPEARSRKPEARSPKPEAGSEKLLGIDLPIHPAYHDSIP